MTSQGQLNGIAAVHLVAAELSLRGYPVAVTARNTEGIDLFASSPKSGRVFALQVKSNCLGDKKRSSNWTIGAKAPKSASDYIYVFVDIHGAPRPHEFFVIESSFVRKRSNRTPKGLYYFKRGLADPYRDKWETLR